MESRIESFETGAFMICETASDMGRRVRFRKAPSAVRQLMPVRESALAQRARHAHCNTYLNNILTGLVQTIRKPSDSRPVG